MPNSPSSPDSSGAARVATAPLTLTARLVGDVPGDVVPEQRVILERLPDAEGGTAIAALDTAGERLGLVPDDTARQLVPLMDLGYPVEGRVLGVVEDGLEIEVAVGATRPE